MKLFCFSILFLMILIACKKPDHLKAEELVALYQSSQNLNSNQTLYKYFAGEIGSKSSSTQYQEVIEGLKNTQKKIIFVHGWDFTETSGNDTLSKSDKITKIQKTWENALEFYDSNTSLIKDNFEVYVYTYPTSNKIESNGTSFINILNTFFSEEDFVVIVAHSMGGLVTRDAFYHENNTKNVIDYVVTLGTPYLGSPFASTAYQADLNVLGAPVALLTKTDGGKDLAYTNKINDATINGAINDYLDSLIDYNAKDNRVYAFYGNLNSCSTDSTLYKSTCTVLETGNPSFLDSDGIVSSTSGKFSNRLSGRTFEKINYNHSNMSFQIEDLTEAKSYFTEVINLILTLQ